MAGNILQASDIISPDVKRELAEIEVALNKIVTTIGGVSAASKILNDSLTKGATSQKETADNINKVNNNLDILAKSEREVQKIEEQTINILAKARAERSEEAKKLLVVAQAREVQNKKIKESITLQNAESDSIARLTAENKKLTAERNKVTTSTDEGRAKIDAFNAKINANNAVIRENTSALEKQKGNVGAYAESLEGAILNIGAMRKELVALRNTSLAGKSLAEIEAINHKMGTLMKEMKDAKMAAKAMGEDFGVLAAGSLKFFVAGIEAVVGSLTALGIESKALEPLQKNIVGLIAVSQALAEIQDTLEQRILQTTFLRIKDTAATVYDSVAKLLNINVTLASTRAEAAKATMQGEASLSTKALAAAQWAYNTALLACPLVLIIAGIGLLAAGITYLILRTGEETKEINKLNAELKELADNKKNIADIDEYLAKREELLGQNAVEKVEAQIEANDRLQDSLEEEIEKLDKLFWMGAASEEQTKRLKEAKEELFKAQLDAQNLELQLEKTKQDELEKLEKQSEKEYRDELKRREDEAKKALERQLKLLETNFEDQKLAEKKNFDKGLISEAQYQQAILAIEMDYNTNKSKLGSKLDRIKAESDNIDKLKALKKSMYDEDVKNLEKQADIETQAAKERYLTGITNEQQFSKEILDIQIKLVQDELKIANLLPDQKLALEKQLQDKLIELKDNTTKVQLANDEKEKKSKEELAKLTEEKQKVQVELANGVFEFGSTLRDRELSALEDEKNKKIAAAGDNAKAKERIEKEYAAKEAIIKRKQAVSDKLQAIFNAGINTAMAITKALSTPALIPWITALGAMQIAAIAAKPIPKFAKGVKGFAGGEAIVGDAGFEMAKLPNGQVFLTPDVATKMLLPKGTDILTHNETIRELQGGSTVQKWDELIKEQRKTRAALSNKTEKNLNITPGGWKYTQEKVNERIEFENKYFRC